SFIGRTATNHAFRIGHKDRFYSHTPTEPKPSENNRAFCKSSARCREEMDMSRTRGQLVSALNNQLKAIKASSAAFDEGEAWEATRLAVAVYVILYDGKGRTVSLLSQLGIKEKIPFVSTSVPANPNGLVAEMPLVIVECTGVGADSGAISTL